MDDSDKGWLRAVTIFALLAVIMIVAQGFIEDYQWKQLQEQLTRIEAKCQ